MKLYMLDKGKKTGWSQSLSRVKFVKVTTDLRHKRQQVSSLNLNGFTITPDKNNSAARAGLVLRPYPVS